MAACAPSLEPAEADKLRETLYVPREQKHERQVAWLRATIESSGAPSAGLEELERLRGLICAGSDSLGPKVREIVERILSWFYRPLSDVEQRAKAEHSLNGRTGEHR